MGARTPAAYFQTADEGRQQPRGRPGPLRREESLHLAKRGDGQGLRVFALRRDDYHPAKRLPLDEVPDDRFDGFFRAHRPRVQGLAVSIAQDVAWASGRSWSSLDDAG